MWPLVSDFGGLVGIMRGVEECRLEGSGLGTDRVIPTGGGKHVVERLTWLDNEAHNFSYTIVSGSPFPFLRYVSTVKLTPAGERTDIEWEGNFDPRRRARGRGGRDGPEDLHRGDQGLQGRPGPLIRSRPQRPAST